jgi:hypothetical protein
VRRVCGCIEGKAMIHTKTLQVPGPIHLSRKALGELDVIASDFAKHMAGVAKDERASFEREADSLMGDGAAAELKLGDFAVTINVHVDLSERRTSWHQSIDELIDDAALDNEAIDKFTLACKYQKKYLVVVAGQDEGLVCDCEGPTEFSAALRRWSETLKQSRWLQVWAGAGRIGALIGAMMVFLAMSIVISSRRHEPARDEAAALLTQGVRAENQAKAIEVLLRLTMQNNSTEWAGLTHRDYWMLAIGLVACVALYFNPPVFAIEVGQGRRTLKRWEILKKTYTWIFGSVLAVLILDKVKALW